MQTQKHSSKHSPSRISANPSDQGSRNSGALGQTGPDGGLDSGGEKRDTNSGWLPPSPYSFVPSSVSLFFLFVPNPYR